VKLVASRGRRGVMAASSVRRRVMSSVVARCRPVSLTVTSPTLLLLVSDDSRRTAVVVCPSPPVSPARLSLAGVKGVVVLTD